MSMMAMGAAAWRRTGTSPPSEGDLMFADDYTPPNGDAVDLQFEEDE